MESLYDIHCHLNDHLYIENEIGSTEVALAANKSGVKYINNVGYDIKSSKTAVLQAEKNQNVFAVVGIHPNEAHLFTDVAYETINDLAQFKKTVAIGEIGLDYTRTKEHKDVQKQSFKKQINIAIKNNLPVMLHIEDVQGSYEAYDDAYEIIKEMKVNEGVIHSFHGTLQIANKFIELGLYISINGNITRNKEQQEVVKELPLDKLVVETDSPYMIPEPYSKQLNYPKYLPLIVEAIANIHKIDRSVVATITTENAVSLFLKW